MTESDWLACDDPTTMLSFMGNKASDRKLRLFACACYRCVWPLFFDKDSFTSVEVAERYAEGEATAEELRMAGDQVMWAADDAEWRSKPQTVNAWAAIAPTQKTGMLAARSAIHDLQSVFAGAKGQEERKAEAGVFRDIFASPFRTIAVGPGTLYWNSGTVTKIAQAVYYDRHLPSGHLDVAHLAILADALEESGCDDSEILGHCRSAGIHVRGCWVVDHLLGKE